MAALKRRSRPEADTRPEAQALLRACKRYHLSLIDLQSECDDHWGSEDRIYRYYHGSFKVYNIQLMTLDIVAALKKLAPKRKMNDLFLDIVKAGTGRHFELSHNERWAMETRPMVEAYFHARHMLEMAIKYGDELEFAPSLLPSGWATLLYLFNMR